MRIAVVRPPGPELAACSLTYLQRAPIDVRVAREEHAGYAACLARLGCQIVTLPDAPGLPDAAFVEDAAVVLDEVAILTRPASAARRAELDSVGRMLASFRPIHEIAAPATLEGGDVLRAGHTLYVGLSTRTNAEGVAMLTDLVAPYGYAVRAVEVHGCLHLKTAASRIAEGVFLVNPDWIDAGAFAGAERIAVHPAEPFAANTVRVGDSLIAAAGHARTHARLEQRGLDVHALPFAELMKAEAGPSCCVIVIENPGGSAGP